MLLEKHTAGNESWGTGRIYGMVEKDQGQQHREGTKQVLQVLTLVPLDFRKFFIAVAVVLLLCFTFRISCYCITLCLEGLHRLRREAA